MHFLPFQHAIAVQFDKLSKQPLFRTGAEKDTMWTTYLSSFPEGSNPIYKERTEHDCNCCKQFVRAVGNAVGIVNGKIETIWDVKLDDENYQAVADSMSKFVKSFVIVDAFLHYEKQAGTQKSFQDTIDGVKTWNHFFVQIPQQFVKPGADIATALSLTRSTHDVFLRALLEIPMESVDTVLELIAQNSIYRGEEHKFAVAEFKKHLKAFEKVKDKDSHVWGNMIGVSGSVTNIRNSVIGTLMTDLAEGKDLSDAVGSYESKVAPTNYKRPTALVTKAMVEKAKKTIEDLGLTSALERRYANISDITINNVLFADRTARVKMQDSVFDAITVAAPKKSKALDKVEEVSIEKFLSDILPQVSGLEVMLENTHTANLVSLVAPVDPVAKPLFKWENNFSWSYNGEVADSIKERVKQAGGNVTGDLCCRLAWFNYDDLDFHMTEPSGAEIWFRDKVSYTTGGKLDVDMNAGGGNTRTPVENIFYGDKDKMKEGVYTLQVNQFSKRETKDIGFEVEMDFMGDIRRYSYPQAVNGTITVAKFKYSHKNGIEFIASLPSTQSVKEVWGIPTQTFHKVNAVMLSPNYWDGFNTGNKHFFFMLDGCLNDGTARGFFNEFLSEELNVHRKVLEVVGSKMQTENSDKQLSGLGFSSTQRNELLVKVSGSFSRIVKVVV